MKTLDFRPALVSLQATEDWATPFIPDKINGS